MLLIQTIKKDFLAYRKTLLWIPFYILVFPAFFTWIADNSAIFVMLAIMCTYLWIGSVLAYDEKYKADSITGILPVNRSTVLLGKIITMDLVLLIVTILYILLSALNLFVPVQIFIFPTFSQFAVGALFSSFMTLLIMPACYKWGYQKSRIVMILVLVFLITLLSGTLAYFDALPDDIINESKIEHMMSLAFPTYFSWVLLGIAAVCQVITYILSYRLIRKKDI